MAHTCRGTINLANAYIHTEDSNTIVISNSGTHTFYLKATSEVERQKWVTALELARADAIKLSEPGILPLCLLYNDLRNFFLKKYYYSRPNVFELIQLF